MKLFKFFSLICASFLTFGCSSANNQDSELKLSAPTGLFFDEATNTLEWSIVSHASSYVINVDGRERDTVGLNYFNIESLSLSFGEHFAKVKSIGEGKYVSSDYCETLSFELVDYENMYQNYSGDKSLSAYHSVPESTLKIANSANLDGKYYLWYFDLGLVKDVPVYSSLAYKYQYDITQKFEFSKCTTTTLMEANERVDERIDSHSTTLQISAGISDTTTKSVEATAGVNISELVNAGVTRSISNSLTISVGGSFEWTNSWGNTITTSQRTEQTYTSTYSEKLEINIAFSEENRFVLDKYYRVSFYESQFVYALLIYDVEKQQYEYSYENFYNSANQTMIIEESDDSLFNYGNFGILDFDLDEAIVLAEANVPKEAEIPQKQNNYVDKNGNEHKDIYLLTPSNTLVFDFREYQKNGTLSNFSFANYSYSTGVLTVNPMLDGWTIMSVEIIGLYGTINSDDGSEFKNSLSSLQIEFSSLWTRDIYLHLKNISFTSREHYNSIKSSQNLNLSIEGKVEIIGSNNSTARNMIDVNGSLAIKGTDSNAEFKIIGHNGSLNENGSSDINCQQLLIDNTKLTLRGGNGGNGSNGTSYDVNADSTGPRNGGNGNNGGNGGSCIIAKQIECSNSVLNLFTGSGGNGGNGGSGEGSHGGGSSKYIGGRGGNGGNGGSAGYALSQISLLNLDNSELLITMGTGGAGGSGGAGGNGHYSWAGCTGQGGPGGNGGIGGSAIIVDYYQNNDFGMLSFIESKIKVLSDIIAGNGGSAGNAGATNNSGALSSCGGSNGGNGGNGGNAVFFSSDCFTGCLEFEGKLECGSGANGGLSSYNYKTSLSSGESYGTSGSGGSSGYIDCFAEHFNSNTGYAGQTSYVSNQILYRYAGAGGSSFAVTLLDGVPTRI